MTTRVRVLCAGTVALIICLVCFADSGTAAQVPSPVRIYVDMVGDLFHGGHVNLLRNAKAMGHELIVGIHSDKAVASYKRTPVMSMDERVLIVQACRYVDKVIPSAPLRITEEFLNEHGISYVVHGDDHANAEMYSVPIRLGKFKQLPYTEGVSTSGLLRRICDRRDALCRNVPSTRTDTTIKSEL